MHQIGEKNTIWKSSQGQKLFILLFFLFFFWLNEGENCTCNGIFSTDYDELLCYIKQYYWMKKKKKTYRKHYFEQIYIQPSREDVNQGLTIKEVDMYYVWQLVVGTIGFYYYFFFREFQHWVINTGSLLSISNSKNEMAAFLRVKYNIST